MNWIAGNMTKILGALQTTLMAMIAAGSFDGLISTTAVRWLGIAGMLVGAATTAVGFNNSSKERIAEAMQTAINATPGEPRA